MEKLNITTKILGKDIRCLDLVSNPLPSKYQSEALPISVSAIYEHIKLAASNPGQDIDISCMSNLPTPRLSPATPLEIIYRRWLQPD
jgi:hypothetical protein